MKRWYKFDKGDGFFQAETPFQYATPEYENMVLGWLHDADKKPICMTTASKFALVPVGRLSLKLVNEYIQIKYPEIELVKGNGYFYVYSDNDTVGLKLAGLYTTSIGVCHLKHASIEKWREMVDYVLMDSDRHESEREPVYPL